MANWIEKYIDLIRSSHKKDTIVCDMDNLFDYPELSQLIEEEGFKIVKTDTELDIRIFFELIVRNSIDRYVIVISQKVQPAPDILLATHCIEVGLGTLFPNLDAKSIQGLSYNALSTLSNIKPYEVLGKDKTLKFLLENLYNVDFDTLLSINAKERVLNVLITVFLERNGVNQALIGFLKNITKPYYPDLVKNDLSQDTLIEYIQSLWNEYVHTERTQVDFSDPTLCKSIGYLFLRDFLKPSIVTEQRYERVPKALRIGFVIDTNRQTEERVISICDYLEQRLGQIEDIYWQWFELVQIISKAMILAIRSKNQVLIHEVETITDRLNNRFQRYLDNTYSSLFSLSGIRHPVVVSRVLDFIKAQPEKRKVMIVIDGLSYWQWEAIAEVFKKDGLSVESKATMAYIPTITAWSRQAIFRGHKPDLDKDNSNEAQLFLKYWKENGYQDFQIGFHYFGIKELFSVDSISSSVDILALVCNDLDDLMHGSILGIPQLLVSTEQWVEKSGISKMIFNLKKSGFQVFLTTDHGNIEAQGIKNLSLCEKVGTISRGKRHIRYSNEVLIQSLRDSHPDLKFGQKDSSLYFTDKSAFALENTTVIAHGGSHLWEVVIPFIHI